MTENNKPNYRETILKPFIDQNLKFWGSSIGYAYTSGYFESILAAIFANSSLTDKDIDMYRKMLELATLRRTKENQDKEQNIT